MSDHEYTKLNDRESESHGQGPARDRNKVNPFVWFAQSDFGQGLLPPPKLLRPGNWNEDSYEKEREVSWSELYFDLVFVVGIARLGEILRENLNEDDYKDGVLGYFAYFLTLWRYWLALLQYSTRFGSDDLFNKLAVPLFMIPIVGMIAQFPGGPNSESNSSGVCVCAAAASFCVILMHARVALYMTGRPLKYAVQIIVGEIITMTLWLIQGLVIDYPQRTMWIWINLGLYFVIWQLPDAVYLCFSRTPEGQAVHEIPLVPIHAEHVVERMGGFVVIFLGEVVDDITEASEHHTKEYFIGLALSFVAITGSKLVTFDTDKQNIEHHIISKSRFWGQVWVLLNIPLSAGFAFMASGMNQILTALNCRDEDRIEGSLCEEEENLVAARKCLMFGAMTGLLSVTLQAMLHERSFHPRCPLFRDKTFRQLQKKVFIFQMTCQFFILGIYLAAAMLSRDRLSDLGVLATLTGCKIFQVALGLVDEVLTGRYLSQLRRIEEREGPAVAPNPVMTSPGSQS